MGNLGRLASTLRTLRLLGRQALAASFVIAAVSTTAATLAAAGTLETVKARGHILCGVGEDAPGFSRSDERGQWSGLDVEFCRALAVAVLGSKDAVKFRSLSPADRFNALTSGEIDVLSGATSWTLSRDTELGIRFVDTLFYDGQGFLVRRSNALTSVLELSGSSVCVQTGTSAEQGLVDFFKAHQMRFQLVVADRWEEIIKAYATGGCTLLTGDMSSLALERTRLANPADHMLLPELITKQPTGPAVRLGDEQWFAIVRWTLMALVAAEEMGLSSQNSDASRSSPLLDVRRFLGVDANLGRGLGLVQDWAYQIVKQVGSYGEIYDRNLGVKSMLRLERGINNLWTRGGLLYAAPFR